MTIWLILGMLAQEPAAPTGPASYWKFDETAAGTAANVVTGAPVGTPQGGPAVSMLVPTLSYNTDIGATPRSLLFDGTNDVVNVANFGTFNRVTVSVWIRRVAGGPAGRQTVVSYKESTVGGFVLSLNESNGTFNPRLWVHNGGWVFAEEALAVAADTWVHLAGVYNGTNILLYRDGTQVASTAAAGNMTTGVGPIGIGARSSFDQHWFPGNIDDVRIYARALTPQEIAVLAAGVPEPVLVSAAPGVNRVDLTWTAPAGAVTYTYNVKRAPSGSGAFVTIAAGVSGTTYPDMSAAPGVPYDYVVTAVSAAESGQSGVMSATAQFPPPRTNDHDEGLMDGNCSCGSIAGGPSAWTLLLAFAALGATFRRRR